MQVGHSCHSAATEQNKKKFDNDALVLCMCVSLPTLQATRPVSSSPQSSQRESRHCGGSASNARLAAAVRIKERMRWVGWERTWPTGSWAGRLRTLSLYFTLLKCQIDMLIDISAVPRDRAILVRLGMFSTGFSFTWQVEEALLFKCL